MAKQATAAIVKSNPDQRSLVETVAERYGIQPETLLSTLKATVFPASKDGATASNEQLAAFLIVANRYELNPFTREIYAFPGRNGGIVPIVSVDGWATLINRQPNLDGIEFEDLFNKEGNLVGITCRIHRKDRSRPIVVTEYMKECKKDTEPWNKWPARMLRHKALIQCARYAFGLTGIADEDEAERMEESNSRTRPMRVIGGPDKTIDGEIVDAKVPAANIPAMEDVPVLSKIHRLCTQLGLNSAKESMFVGQYTGKLDQLAAELEAKIAQAGTGSEPQASESTGDEAPNPAQRPPSKGSPSTPSSPGNAAFNF